MPDMYSLERNGDGEVTISQYETRQAAYKAACHEMMEEISQNLQFWASASNATELLDDAKKINGLVSRKSYQDAIDIWNDSEVNCCVTYSICDAYIILEDDVDDPTIIDFDDDNDVLPTTIRKPFVATKSGATCRGPCHNFNEFANSDSSDDTYVCYSCKSCGAK